jgi:hypothetical protein
LPKLIGAGELKEIPSTWSKIPASKRFVLVLNNKAVLDKATGRVWARDACLKDSSGFHLMESDDAYFFCRDLVIGNRKGWRLPTAMELLSLVYRSGEGSEQKCGLPSGHPFQDVQNSYYWSSTHDPEGFETYIMKMTDYVGPCEGEIIDKYDWLMGRNYVWPVLDGTL